MPYKKQKTIRSNKRRHLRPNDRFGFKQQKRLDTFRNGKVQPFLCLNISDYLISRFQDEAYEQLHLHATSHCRGEPSVRPRA